ncbi:site-specific integrase [Marinobacter sp. NP-6]|uniref:tyrosine-type recombinase/integrase n=1 Tax=Marinobacter sp. NP-6 TaxID=2488666 RepID=UPI000FC9F8DB|nr:site-specific integrase [Marinobacter sp. NP-6]RUT76891.1 site-specific integrase [Marinobacter sp. NP-6]
MSAKLNIPISSDPYGDEYRKLNRFTPDKKAREKNAAIEVVQREFPEIFTPTENKVVPDTLVDALFKAACGDLPGQEKRVRHNTLVKLLQDKVRNHNWILNIPGYALMEQGVKAIAHPESFARLRPYRALDEVFMESLMVPTPAPNQLDEKLRQYEAGQLLFSMISRGGLHHSHWLQAAVDRLPQGVEGHEQSIWIDLHSGVTLRRWFPDPISALLIRRWCRRWEQQWPDASLEQLLKVFLASVTDSAMAVPVSLDFLLNTAATASSIDQFGFIYNYQTTRNANVSLPETAWWRLITKRIPHRADGGPREPIRLSSCTPSVDALELVGECAEDGLARLQHVQKALRPTENGKTRSRKMMTKALSEVAENERLAPIVRVLSLWCRALITRRQKNGENKLKVSSVRTYLSRIGPPLAVMLAGTKDLNELEEDDWEYLYEELISTTKSRTHQLNRAISLRQFHQFLVDRFALPDANIERVSGEDRRVDAELLTPAEYIRALHLLRLHTTCPRLMRIQRLVLILGFRCGLRRGEVQKIQLRDLPGVCEPELDDPQLLIRPSAFGSIKTNAGIRKLPLTVLLTPNELRELRYWTQQRLLEQTSPRPMELLFCERHQSHRVLSSSELFAPIQEAMRSVSGAVLRFHHLRHSFATFTGLRLLESAPGALMREEWAMDDEGEIVMPHWGEDFSALAELASAGTATGKRLWLLGQWCGHVTPGETLQTYSHLIDWVSYQGRLAVEETQLSLPQQAYLLGISLQSVSRFRSRKAMKGPTNASDLLYAANAQWPDGCRKSRTCKLKIYRTPVVPSHVLDEIVKPRISAMQLYNIFQKIGALQARGKSETEAIEKAAAYYGQNLEAVTKWHRRAMKMMNDPSDKKAFIDHTIESGRDVVANRIHRRWSAHHQDQTPNPFFENSPKLGTTRPELNQCPAPPTPHIAQEYCEIIFDRFVSWSESEPKAFSAAMNAVQNAMQRSHQQISFRSDVNKKRYRQLLREAQLCRLIRVRVKAPPNRNFTMTDLKQHWSEEFGVSQARVRLLNERARSDRREWGVSQIEIIPDVRLGDACRQMTMSTVRFAMFAAAVVFEGELEIDCKRRLL